MTNDTAYWKAIREEGAPMPGPPAFFVSGYSRTQLEILRTFLNALDYEETPLLTCRKNQLDLTLEQALAETPESDDELPDEGALPYVCVISGQTMREVQTVMRTFKENGLPRPIFATTTPTNLGFTVKTLLLHLLEEQRMASSAKPERSEG